MALPTYLDIKANGEDVPVLFGEDATHQSLGGTDVAAYLECVEFDVAVEVPSSSSTGRIGRRTWTPARFVVRVGRSTPWLFEAARLSKRIDLTLYFFHQHHETGETEQHVQYRVENGRLVGVRLVHPSGTDADAHELEDYVELRVAAANTEIESMTGGTLMVDEAAVV